MLIKLFLVLIMLYAACAIVVPVYDPTENITHMKHIQNVSTQYSMPITYTSIYPLVASSSFYSVVSTTTKRPETAPNDISFFPPPPSYEATDSKPPSITPESQNKAHANSENVGPLKEPSRYLSPPLEQTTVFDGAVYHKHKQAQPKTSAWKPIIPKPNQQNSVFKALQDQEMVLSEQLQINEPSIKLQPPKAYSIPNVDFYKPLPSAEFQVPELRPQSYRVVGNNESPYIVRHHGSMIKPFKIIPLKHIDDNSNKFREALTFTPIPIPIQHVPTSTGISIKASKKPKNQKELQKLLAAEEKRRYKEERERQEMLNGENESGVNYTTDASEETTATEPSSDEDTTERGLHGNRKNGTGDDSEQDSNEGPEDRTEFRMHGMKGPNSYKFGYDTGKGRNRQFRFEERDNDGSVRGKYGYIDHTGKLQVVNYDATPNGGFHATVAQ